jgi:hypothetical protein
MAKRTGHDPQATYGHVSSCVVQPIQPMRATDLLAIILFGGPANRRKAAKTGWCLPMAIALHRYFPTNVAMM